MFTDRAEAKNTFHANGNLHWLLRRFRTLAIIVGGFAFSACGNVTSGVEARSDAPITIVYDWINGDTPAGEQVLTINNDGSRTTSMRVQWNNRDFILKNEMQFDSNGYVSEQHLTGTSAFGAKIDEEFSIKEGKASWRNPSEHGEKILSGQAYYVPARSGATETLAGLIRAGLTTSDGVVKLLPSGEAEVKKLTTETVSSGEIERTVNLYSITGLEFSPTYVWLDQDQNFFAFSFWGMTLAPKGWGMDVRNQLQAAQAVHEDQYYHDIASQHAEKLAGPLLIKNVDIVDVETGKLLLKKNVLSDNGVITKISDAALDEISVRVIDGTGKTLIPGLWDMHTHVEFFSHYGAIFHIAGGVTTVRDMGSDHEALMRAKDDYDKGELVGPHIYASGFIDKKSPFAETRAVETLEEAKEKVAWYADHGYIQIKLYSSIAPEWVAPLAALAHEKGLRIGGHIPAFMTAEQAVRDGYDEISHINFLFLNFLAGKDDDTRTRLRFYLFGDEAGNLDLDSPKVEEFISLLVSKHVVLDPTVAVFDSMIGQHAGEPNPLFTKVIDNFPIAEYRSALSPGFEIAEDKAEAWSNSQRKSLEFIRKLHDSGIQILAGTDALPGFSMHRELELYAEAGLATNEILKIATIDAARVLGQDDLSGSIKEGKRADMVLLNSNPLENISAIRDIDYVITHDRLYKPEELLSSVGVRPH